ncbi:MAG TPA: L-glutamate gamma-semialdehyde dehydrogenase [Ktedonobacterales bacterium]|jgi:1-pyrroline-5-carboxylate dehydrogenase
MTSTAHRATSAVLPEFQNCPLTDFSVEANRRAQEAALQKVQSELGRTYPLIIGGEKITTAETFTSVNPAHPGQVVGVVAKATVELANKAVEVAARTFESWKRVPAAERAAYLFKAAEVMRQRRLELNAWMIYEASKSWVEADADTAEAIDFLEFYGREMLRLADKQPLTRIPGEENDLRYIPLGVGVAIPPWNFPCAIMAGLTTSALVAGNTVILKPASTTPIIAAQFVNILHEVGLPAGVVNFLPGPGGAIGDALVEHPKVRFISFTGSRDVGLRINQLAAKPQRGQLWIKRTVLEMGGKDAVVVDETADLDAAATGIVASAFGFQGQKCSAGSRAIIVGQVYDQVVQKVVEKARALAVGDPTNPQNVQGAVIDENAFRKISEYIQIGEKEGKLLLGGTPHPSEGYFIPPTIFADVAPNARLAQEEIFGPVLAITKAEDYEEALAIANGTEYGLTGAFYSRNQERLERAKDDFHVGNLYLNRKCTGALVGVHPFGGFNMSGTDSKAGGRDYLLLFTQAKALSEKV